jgi:prevent-host-death family protein
MRTVTAMDLRKRLGQILDAAAAGEPIAIERDGRPMAVLVTPEAASRLGEDEQARVQRGLAALDRLDEFRERMARLHPRGPGDPGDAAEAIRSDRVDRADQVLRAAARTPEELARDLEIPAGGAGDDADRP